VAESSWFVYLLKCSDDSYYAGIAQNVEERLERHQTGRGAEYTKARLPVELVYVEKADNHSQALAREKWLKRQTHRVKEELIREWIAAKKASPNRG
jgi:putative endonuclease